MTNGGLEGRVAVVTGGATGIGEAICLRLARDGASVVVLDVNEPAAELTAALCGGRAAAADVSDGAAVDVWRGRWSPSWAARHLGQQRGCSEHSGLSAEDRRTLGAAPTRSRGG